jgi:hypothetical protein
MLQGLMHQRNACLVGAKPRKFQLASGRSGLQFVLREMGAGRGGQALPQVSFFCSSPFQSCVSHWRIRPLSARRLNNVSPNHSNLLTKGMMEMATGGASLGKIHVIYGRVPLRAPWVRYIDSVGYAEKTSRSDGRRICFTRGIPRPLFHQQLAYVCMTAELGHLGLVVTPKHARHGRGSISFRYPRLKEA